MLFKKGVLLQCDVCGKDCRDGDYFKGHMKTVHEGVSPTVLFVLFFLYWGVYTNIFCDETLVCEDGHIKTHKFIISSCSQLLENKLVWCLQEGMLHYSEHWRHVKTVHKQDFRPCDVCRNNF